MSLFIIVFEANVFTCINILYWFHFLCPISINRLKSFNFIIGSYQSQSTSSLQTFIPIPCRLVLLLVEFMVLRFFLSLTSKRRENELKQMSRNATFHQLPSNRFELAHEDIIMVTKAPNWWSYNVRRNGWSYK